MSEPRKTCSKCGIERPLEAFGRNRSRKDDRHPVCRDCQRAIDAARRADKLARGECEKCPHPAAPGKTRCPDHLEKKRQYGKKLRTARRELGLCRDCPAADVRPAVAAGRCEKCLDNRNRRRRERGRPENHRRRARKRGGIVEPYSKKDLLLRDNYRCYCCGTRVTEDTCHVEHLLPFYLAERVGGAYDVPLNVRISCVRCNLSLKGNRWLTWHSIAAAEQLGKVYGNARLTGWVQRIGESLERVQRGNQLRELLPGSHLSSTSCATF